VTYEQKHNHANGEDNRDGHEPNHSRNWGAEGPTDDPNVNARRRAVRRSLMATLLLSQGVPMILGGDEIGRTQGGNNNAYCQDNDVSWYDWAHVDEAFLEQVRALIAFRREHPLVSQRRFLGWAGSAGATWWHASGRPMQETDWHNPHEGILGLELRAADGADGLFLAVNPLDHPVVFVLPQGAWDVAAPFIDLARGEDGLLHLDGLSVAALVPAD
ncbi:MAG: glycogen debranching enzyme GlgX, partial [Rhodothermales bacterium]